jgi:hypothetical protein
MTLSHHQTRAKCRSNVSPFSKLDTWVHTLLKRRDTFLTKISLRYGAAAGAPIGPANGRRMWCPVLSYHVAQRRMWL